MAETDGELLRSSDAARALGVTTRTIHRWADAGKLEPAQRVPGYRGVMLFRRSDVEALAAAAS